MEIKTIDSQLLSNMFLAGAKCLEDKKELINELNVFPVPDGDTGTNMTMTIMSAAREVVGLDHADMKTVSKAISAGSLRGARGNSGVILSQLLRGFTKVSRNFDELDAQKVADGFEKAVETAYKAVMKPKEGTILTVAKGAAEKAREVANSTDDLTVLCEEIVKAAEETLAKTPDMLPVLKQAGVVDSGGRGLVEVLRGAYLVLTGEITDFSLASDESEQTEENDEKADYTLSLKINKRDAQFETMRSDFKVYVEGKAFDISETLSPSSLILSVQTNEPGRILNRACMMGYVTDLSLTYNKLSNDSSSAKSQSAACQLAEEVLGEKKAIGFVTVSIGEGINNLFRDLGADYVIEGGQTMNPSTEDILDAVKHVNAETIFVLPNNKNIILAANQAVSLCTDKKLVVIPTKTVPQGITALINFIPDESAEDNEKRMREEIGNVKTGQVTYAVRDTLIDDKEIHQGDFMGIGDSGILAVDTDMAKTIFCMLDQIVQDEDSLISLYYGADVDSSDAEMMADMLRIRYSGLDVELTEGGQPVYYYVLSVE